MKPQVAYWDNLAAQYQGETRISLQDFHFGPLLPGDRELGLLPKQLEGLRCLELGCGAGQNSIYLASQGAQCCAIDFSPKQLDFGRKLAEQEGLNIDWREADMESLPPDLKDFDLIHSAYGIPFALDPARLILDLAGRMAPGARLLFSMGHPVYAGEWLELDDEEQGIFLQSYYHPQPDVREGEEDSESSARAYPISECVSWLNTANLQLLDLQEPRALPVSSMSPAERERRVPYDSEAWAEQENELRRFPIVAVFSAEKA